MTPPEVCSFCRRPVDPADRELTPVGPLHIVCARQVDVLVASADLVPSGPRCVPGPPGPTVDDVGVWVRAWAATVARHPDVPADEAEMRCWFAAAIEAGATAAGRWASGEAF